MYESINGKIFACVSKIDALINSLPNPLSWVEYLIIAIRILYYQKPKLRS